MQKVFRCREYSRALMHVAAVFFVTVFAAQMARAQVQNKNRITGSVPIDAPSLSFRLRAQLPATPYRWFASTDPKHRNADYLLLKPNETRRIPLTAGTLLRLWSTSSAPEKTTLILQNKARVPLMQNGKARVGELHEKAYTLYPTASQSSLRVLASDAALLVTNGARAETKFFYQAAIAPASQTAPRVLASSARTVQATTKNIALKAGEESEFWRAEKSGAIDSIEIRFATLPADWNAIRLRATWDENEEENAVNVPLGALAANFYGAFSSRNALWSFDGKVLTLRAEMPFTKGAKLSLLNGGAQELRASTRVSSRAAASVSPLRFCARFGSAQTQKGVPLEIVSAKGSGAFLGFSLGVKPLLQSGRRAFAYLEGNETIEADGRSYEGTGTEDFFNSAWYFPQKPFARPLHGFTFRQNVPPQFSAYRLMIPDAVPFGKSLRVVQEHGNRNNTDDLEYSWVAYWYQKTPLNFSVEEVKSQSVKAENASPESSQNTTLAASLAIVLGGIAALVFRRKMTSHEKKS